MRPRRGPRRRNSRPTASTSSSRKRASPGSSTSRGVDRERRGIGLAEGRVPATMLFAVAGDRIVGRVHIRHALTPALRRVGGHIGYAVRPAWRGRGFATEMLRRGLAVLRDLGVTRALVTCDDDNVGSIRTIERNGGVLEGVFALPGGALKRRYWIESGG